MMRVDAPRLSALMAAELRARQVDEQSAEHVAASLVETSLRGVDSHGINLFPYYVSAVEGGRINRSPSFAVKRDRPSAATLDADHGFGHHAGAAAMDLAIAM